VVTIVFLLPASCQTEMRFNSTNSTYALLSSPRQFWNTRPCGRYLGSDLGTISLAGFGKSEDDPVLVSSLHHRCRSLSRLAGWNAFSVGGFPLRPLLRAWYAPFSFRINFLILSFQVSYLILHKYEPEDFFAVSGLVLVPPSVIVWICREVQSQNSPAPTSVFAAYLSLLLGYTVTYRVSPFHPLARYPGPFLARVSKLFMTGVVSMGHARHYYRRLHDQHGDIVRTGACSTRPHRSLFTNVRYE